MLHAYAVIANIKRMIIARITPFRMRFKQTSAFQRIRSFLEKNQLANDERALILARGRMGEERGRVDVLSHERKRERERERYRPGDTDFVFRLDEYYFPPLAFSSSPSASLLPALASSLSFSLSRISYASESRRSGEQSVFLESG